MKIMKNPLRGYSVKVQGSKIVGQLERTRMFTALLQMKSRFKNQKLHFVFGSQIFYFLSI